jgi:anti-sigma B factor antagonist
VWTATEHVTSRLEKIVRSDTGSQEQPWSFTLGEKPGTVILAGEIDFSVTPKVRERLLRVIASDVAGVELDLSGLSYVDSSGLALFIEARRMLLNSGRTIRITAISPQVRKLFHLTQIGDLFGLAD